MNNLEVFDDFKKLLTETYPNLDLNERDEMLLLMAVNHTFLCLSGKREQDNV